MAIIRVTKEFRFEMAHALWNYDGPCRNVHGHSYILYVTFSGEPVNDAESSRNGMVMDFGDMKKIVRENVVARLDHALMISGFAPADSVESYRKHFGNVIVSPYQPTCENIVADIAALLGSKTPPGVSLHSIKLYETATSFAEWHASDNL
jgi:6-pyruvoyltetrahydropterin/6-carboxytetrahydropterin synthase